MIFRLEIPNPNPPDAAVSQDTPRKDFIREMVADDVATGRFGRADPHALPARAQRLPAHRARQVDLPQLRHRHASSAARCNLRFDDTNPFTEDIKYVDAIKRDMRVARLRVGRRVLRQRLLRAAVRHRRVAGREGQGVRRLAERGGDPRTIAARSRTPGTPSPYRDRTVDGESRPAARA